jgi:hypothetical protein
MDQALYDFVLNEIGPSSASVAKLAARIFDKKYLVHIIGRKRQWFEREPGNKFKPIVDIIIRNRLTNELPDIIRSVREQFKNDPEYTKIDDMCYSQSLDAIKLTLVSLIEKRRALREINKIDESREIDQQIKDTEAGIEYLTTKQNLQRSDIKDRKYSVLVNIEDKLYNRSFKNDVIKDLEDILYEPHD